MKKRLSRQNAPGGEGGKPTLPGGTPSHSRSKKAPPRAPSTPPPAEESTAREKVGKADGQTVKNDVKALDPALQTLVNKMLTEGSTFEDVVEAIQERGDGITLNAVQNYFQGNLSIQKKRVRYLMQSADALLATVDKNPKSAEAQLARATFLTGYSRVRRDASLITPKDAERTRMERENLALKHQILVMRKKKAAQDLDYSRARTRLILLTQGKLQEEILKLQREVTAHRAGEPMGPEMLQRIQQLYGLACQPLLYEENANAAAKA